VSLANHGGRKIKVSELKLELTREDGVARTMPAQTFKKPDGAPGSLLFTQLTIEPNQEWANFVNFSAPFSDSDERLSKRLTRDLRLDIEQKLAAQKAAGGPDRLVEADAAQVAPLLAFFHTLKFWHPVEYKAKLVASCEPKRASAVKSFRFTLFESDVQELEERATRYKYGYGVYIPDSSVSELYPRIKDLV
jgi:hypothetical protein